MRKIIHLNTASRQSRLSMCYYQLRFVCLIKEIQSQTIDPDYNQILERKFVKIDELNDYLKWGNIGNHLVMRAKEWFEKQKEDKKQKQK